MEKTLLDVATRLSDDELVRRVRLLAIREREATVELVAHLAELDTRKLYLAQGYSSLFTYCTEVLRLAEHAAYNRIEAARASRRFPAILDRLADGSLNLSTRAPAGAAPHAGEPPERPRRGRGEEQAGGRVAGRASGPPPRHASLRPKAPAAKAAHRGSLRCAPAAGHARATPATSVTLAAPATLTAARRFATDAARARSAARRPPAHFRGATAEPDAP